MNQKRTRIHRVMWISALVVLVCGILVLLPALPWCYAFLLCYGPISLRDWSQDKLREQDPVAIRALLWVIDTTGAELEHKSCGSSDAIFEFLDPAFRARDCLQDIGVPSIPYLLNALESPHPLSRVTAVQVLGDIGDPDLICHLELYLDKQDHLLRESTMLSIRKIKMRHGLPSD